MAKMTVEKKPKDWTDIKPADLAPETTEVSVPEMRMGNQLIPPKSIRVGRMLTAPLVSIAHEVNLVIECTGEIYEKDLPLKGRSNKSEPASLLNCVDWTDVEHPREVILVCNVMIRSALTPFTGSLKGRFFAIADAGLMGDKAYRNIEVRELEVER